MATKGPEAWRLEGRDYSVGSTYFVILSPGEQLQYTIEYLASDPRVLDWIDDEPSSGQRGPRAGTGPRAQFAPDGSSTVLAVVHG